MILNTLSRGKILCLHLPSDVWTSSDDVIWLSGQSAAGLGYKLPSGSIAYAYWYVRWDPSDFQHARKDLSPSAEVKQVEREVEAFYLFTVAYLTSFMFNDSDFDSSCLCRVRCHIPRKSDWKAPCYGWVRLFH